MTISTPEELHRFWQVQQRAMKAGLRLTADRSGVFHVRDNGRDETAADLDQAEQLIAAAEAVAHE